MNQAVEAVPGRLDAVVAERLGIARADAQRAIEAGGVTVDGLPQRKSFRLAGGERVEADLERGAEVPAEGPPVGVRYRNEHLAVVSKPARMPTHPTENRRGGTLVNSLLAMDIPLASLGGALRPGIVPLLEATPHTGRTHQIRVHLSSVGHPILGDARYGGGGQDARALGLERPFLHSSRIAFDHPITRKRIDIEEPLPYDLTEALRRLRDAATS